MSPKRSSQKISPVVLRLSGVFKMDLFTLILCGVCLSSREPSLSKRRIRSIPSAPLIPKRVLDIQLATVTAPSVMRRSAARQSPTRSLVYLQTSFSLKSLGASCQTTLTSRRLMRCEYLLIIHLLHRVTLVTETLL